MDVPDELRNEIDSVIPEETGRVAAGAIVGFWKAMSDGGIPEDLARKIMLQFAASHWGHVYEEDDGS